jgi:hypothetical protein
MRQRLRSVIDERSVDLARDVPLQASDNLPLGLSLRRPPRQVIDRGLATPPEPDHHDAVKRRVRVPVPAAVQSVPYDLARGSLDRGDAAELGERGLRSKAPRVVARRNLSRICPATDKVSTTAAPRSAGMRKTGRDAPGHDPDESSRQGRGAFHLIEPSKRQDRPSQRPPLSGPMHGADPRACASPGWAR